MRMRPRVDTRTVTTKPTTTTRISTTVTRVASGPRGRYHWIPYPSMSPPRASRNIRSPRVTTPAARIDTAATTRAPRKPRGRS